MDKYKHSVAGGNLKSARIALQILEILVDNGVEGMSLNRLSELMATPRTSLHRYLQMLVESGWVETVGEKSSMLWKPSNHFIKLAFNYRDAVRAQVQAIESEFKDLTGEEL
ncbi:MULTISPECIES: helix-turn-helix domain-containing protein [unclassified Vibrio]|uniref:helix-turn-helix domain-containing protein n=1 Tax=unclassified Vibrio TaxID=2614977 RepID=UPI001A8FF02E|nr:MULTISPECIES: helix-turn-helix domain-containing protein [unclassified Vibrio]MBO0209338.1 helix-turn-helix domain-containing protein [Vibrio sp. Vb0877]MDU9596071.1 helix-turn-helix domain-containing protein [Vibrio sp. 2-1-2a]MDU9605439.1 helix-turn-helix domain-containing protein [Vibrio sp. 1-2-3a]